MSFKQISSVSFLWIILNFKTHVYEYNMDKVHQLIE